MEKDKMDDKRTITSTSTSGGNADNTKAMQGTAYAILIIISISHFLNDMIQSVVPSIYPMIKEDFSLSFAQIGLITFVFQLASSILQPFTGLYADRHPRPYALSLGMCFTLAGLLLLAFAGNFWMIILAVSVIGFGSTVFHPEAPEWRRWHREEEKSCAVYLPGGRQRRVGRRTAVGGSHSAPFRTVGNLLVCHRCNIRFADNAEGGQMV